MELLKHRALETKGFRNGTLSPDNIGHQKHGALETQDPGNEGPEKHDP